MDQYTLTGDIKLVGQEILFRSDYTYIAKQKSFYKVHQQPETWLEAKRICALEDATLFHPENAKEAKDVKSFISNSMPWITVIQTSLNDIDIEGYFQTIDGRPISDVYSNWKKGEPNNKRGNEDCVAILGDGLLNDSDCNLKKHFVCKKPLHSVHWNSKCNMSNSGYTFNEYTGNCYKLHTKPMTWFDAYRTCIMEQSNLAMIDSELQRNLLRNLTKDAVTIRIQEAYQKGIFHLGFHNRYDHGWATTKGKPLEMVHGNNWWGGFYPGYTFNEYTGNCYKLHTKPMTWFDAYRTCIMEQSNLAMIDSELQRNLLRNLTKDAVTIRIQEAYQKGIFHLGFHNRYDHGWATTKGKPLEMVPEENWWGGFYPGEGCHNNCGAMFYNGYLVNINCQTKSLFICEHQLNNQVKPDTTRLPEEGLGPRENAVY
ncbi:unnamed protein product [Spodoptera exigua]|nr:unnamed protein product [Spodoptera exigua]